MPGWEAGRLGSWEAGRLGGWEAGKPGGWGAGTPGGWEAEGLGGLVGGMGEAWGGSNSSFVETLTRLSGEGGGRLDSSIEPYKGNASSVPFI